MHFSTDQLWPKLPATTVDSVDGASVATIVGSIVGVGSVTAIAILVVLPLCIWCWCYKNRGEYEENENLEDGLEETVDEDVETSSLGATGVGQPGQNADQYHESMSQQETGSDAPENRMNGHSHNQQGLL